MESFHLNFYFEEEEGDLPYMYMYVINDVNWCRYNWCFGDARGQDINEHVRFTEYVQTLE